MNICYWPLAKENEWLGRSIEGTNFCKEQKAIGKRIDKESRTKNNLSFEMGHRGAVQPTQHFLN